MCVFICCINDVVLVYMCMYVYVYRVGDVYVDGNINRVGDVCVNLYVKVGVYDSVCVDENT